MISKRITCAVVCQTILPKTDIVGCSSRSISISHFKFFLGPYPVSKVVSISLGKDKNFTFALLALGRPSIFNLGPNLFFSIKEEDRRSS
ncbi:MAG: hypothetical protein [Circular genetic element sp.]|nr:MAG: hypothetical protein [Circular genetic element sp.]